MNITSKKVIQFYNDHPHFDLNEMNELFVDLITNVLSQTPKDNVDENAITTLLKSCLLYTSPSPRDKRQSRMPSSA